MASPNEADADDTRTLEVSFVSAGAHSGEGEWSHMPRGVGGIFEIEQLDMPREVAGGEEGVVVGEGEGCNRADRLF
jgi:hypothetical protein